MLGDLVKRVFDRPMDAIAGKVVQGGMSANALTSAGLGMGVVGCFFTAMYQFPLALVFLLLNRFFDALAAGAARQTGITARGSYLDIVSDFIVFGGFAFGFSLAMTEHLMGAAFLLFSYLVMACAWLGHRIFGTLDGVHDTERFKGGIVGSAEITIFMIVCCLYPPGFSYFAMIMGLLCWATAILRVRRALTDF